MPKKPQSLASDLAMLLIEWNLRQEDAYRVPRKVNEEEYRLVVAVSEALARTYLTGPRELSEDEMMLLRIATSELDEVDTATSQALLEELWQVWDGPEHDAVRFRILIALLKFPESCESALIRMLNLKLDRSDAISRDMFIESPLEECEEERVHYSDECRNTLAAMVLADEIEFGTKKNAKYIQCLAKQWLTANRTAV